jgi:hypothetical protein
MATKQCQDMWHPIRLAALLICRGHGGRSFHRRSKAIGKVTPCIPDWMQVDRCGFQVTPLRLSRMFQMLGEETRSDSHIVHTMDEAYQLLYVQSPKFVPVSWAKTG